MNDIINTITTSLSDVLCSDLIIFLISMVPILELRGGHIAASFLHVDMWRAVVICIIGNIIPIPFILLLIKQIFAWLKKTKPFHGLITRLEERAMSKSDSIEKYGFWGLMLFVGIPLPGTGAWTGALIAALLGMKLRKSVPAILCGLIMATVIMCIFSYGILGKIW